MKNTYKKNAGWIGALFISTMLVGMVDAYFVAPLFKQAAIEILYMPGTLLLGVFSVFGMAIGVVFIALFLFPVIKRQSETVALTYVILRAIECLLLLVGALCYLFIIGIGQDNLSPVDASHYSVAIASAVKIKYYGYQIAMMVLGIGSLFLCYSLYESRIVPRFLSVWGGIGYLFLLLSAVLDICGLISTTNGIGAVLYIPGGLWEMIAFPLWLFTKGFKMPLETT